MDQIRRLLVFIGVTLGPLASGPPNLGPPLSCGLSLSEILDTCLVVADPFLWKTQLTMKSLSDVRNALVERQCRLITTVH